MPLCPKDVQATDLYYFLFILRTDLLRFHQGLCILFRALLPFGHGKGKKLRITPQEDVRTPSRHVRRDRHCLRPACLGDNLSLSLMDLCIQDMVRDALSLQHLRYPFGLIDRQSSHEDRFSLLVQFFYLGYRCLKLLLFRPVHDIRIIGPDKGSVGRYDHYIEVVNLLEFHGLRVRRSGHTCKFTVHPEIVLERHRGEGLVLPFDLYVLFRLQCLVKALAEPSSRHKPPGKLVHNDDLAILYDVVHIPLKKVVGLQGLVEVMEQVNVLWIIKVIDVDELLNPGYPFLGEIGTLRLLINHEILLLLQLIDELVDLVILVRGFLGRTGNYERGPCLVNKDTVYLVDNSIVELPVDTLIDRILHVVPEVVETEFIVRAVGNITPVGEFPLVILKTMDDDPDR
ncbi:MAG: hypothetical protein A4E62_02516 [Syntrophorhabdus sp. PtaU1.Bin002]|nr:MAG: hypothetical protein A4E62_02516 [Syntrophorhabdus sp. PtaU1.Bin002]